MSMNDGFKCRNQLWVEKFMALTHEDPRALKLQAIPVAPTAEVSLEVRRLRARLMLEETLETIRDGLGLEVSVLSHVHVMGGESEIEFKDVKAVDLVGLVDGLADQHVVLMGAASAFGVAFQPIFEAVMDNNCGKFGPGHYVDEGGKLVKPPGHKPPDLDSLLRLQGWRGH